jgi:hypothetical protein
MRFAVGKITLRQVMAEKFGSSLSALSIIPPTLLVINTTLM